MHALSCRTRQLAKLLGGRKCADLGEEIRMGLTSLVGKAQREQDFAAADTLQVRPLQIAATSQGTTELPASLTRAAK